MIFVPLTSAELGTLVDGGELGEVPAYTATTALRAEHGLGPGDEEEADFLAFGHAGAAAVARTSAADPGRTVLAVDAPAGTVRATDTDPYGAAVAGPVRWSDVTAVYLDEPDAAPAVAAARDATVGQDLPQAYDQPALRSLLGAHDLLWHLPSEVAH